MAGYTNTQFRFLKIYGLRIALCLSWLLGIFFGSQLCMKLEPPNFLMMRSVFFQPVSIVGLLVSVFLPLIITYFSIVSSKPILIVIVCFLKAAAFGFSGVLISRLFGTASWLLCFLYLFSDSCFLLPLFILWFRRCGNVRIIGLTDVYLCAAVGLLTVAVDYFSISPILAGLF